MTLVARRLSSGLVSAEFAADEAAVSRALKRIDDRLVLWPPDGMSPYYRVARSWSDEHEADVICTWMDATTREPLQLSSGLIDEVDRLRRDARSKGLDVDASNALRAVEVEREREQRGLAIVEEHRPKIERGRVTVSLGPGTSKREWQRNRRPPQHGKAA